MDLTLLNLDKMNIGLSDENDSQPERILSDGEVVSAPEKPPAESWQEMQDALAEAAGLSIVLVDGQQPPSLAISNNNSVCRVLQSTQSTAHLCQTFCGNAFENVQKVKKTISYRCHAGLQCAAVPFAPNPIRPLVAIVGRAFTKVADYQNLLDRASNGDWQELPSRELFQDLIFAESAQPVEELAARLGDLEEIEAETLVQFVARTEPNPLAPNLDYSSAPNESEKIAQEVKPETQTNGHHAEPSKIEPPQQIESAPVEKKRAPKITAETIALRSQTIEDFAAWQLFIDVLLDKSFKDACTETLRFLAARYGFTSLAWLERSAHVFRPFLVAENMREVLAYFSLMADDASLQEAALSETSWRIGNGQKLEVFPLVVGDDMRAAIVIADEITDDERRTRIARFCHQIAVSLEVLRLREELTHRAEIVRAVQLFSEKLNNAEEYTREDSSVNLFDTLMQTCAELLHATRGSLLMFDEESNQLKVQSAFGRHAADLRQTETQHIGERVAERVWREGKPVVVENVTNVSLPPAPVERGYKSKSFISFPLIVGNRVIGVLNVTDKKDGTSYGRNELDLLEAIAPQLSIALDRAHLQKKAGVFEQLSITDALTGLLNRRYLNERLQEEVSRSNRDGSPMSFMMLDVDNFKQYNDRFGHQAGDEVLRLTAQCLKAVLRGADVAARFGGEEFSLLLPNTTLSEARLIGERIRQRVEGTDFPHRAVTVSVGVAAYSPLHNSPSEIIEAADKALYQAKRIGKNNVQLWLFGQTRR